LTPPALIALGFDQSKALLDSAGHPGLPISQSMSGATAEKASRLETVSSPLKAPGSNSNQIVYAPPDDPLLVLRCRLSPFGMVQQQPGGNFPFLLSRRPEVPVEIFGRDRRQSLRPVREFPGDAEIVKGRKPVPEWNRFWTATRIAWRIRKILAELPFRAKANFGASILCRHAESRPLGVATQAFRRVSETDQ
jgi:hypothetical protein